MTQSKGEYRVGIDFNPSGRPMVDKIKRQAADLIDSIEDVCAVVPAEDYPEGSLDMLGAEVGRLKAHAQTLVEDAAMNAVKAATKRVPS